MGFERTPLGCVLNNLPSCLPRQRAGKLVILEDTDGDGKADQSTVFADDLHIPLSFEFGEGGVFISEMPDLTFLKDTDGDDVADVREATHWVWHRRLPSCFARFCLDT